VAIFREPCWHQCPHCRKDWCHSVNSSAPPDSYFTPCGPCQVIHGFDAVEQLEKRCRHARVVEAEDDEFAVLLPEREQE
jgi:hypothetical protein